MQTIESHYSEHLSTNYNIEVFKIENLLYASFLATSDGIFYHWQIRKMQTQTCSFASYQANCMQNFCREQNEIT